MQSGKSRFPSREIFEASIDQVLSSSEPRLRKARRLSGLAADWLSDVEEGLITDVQPAVESLAKALAEDPQLEDGGRWLQDHANLLFAEILRVPETKATYDAMLREVNLLEGVIGSAIVQVAPSVWNIFCAGIRRLATAKRIVYHRLYAVVDKAVDAATKAGKAGDLGRALLNAGNARFNDPQADPQTNARLAYPFYAKAISNAVWAKERYLEAQCRYSAGVALIDRFDYATEKDFTRASSQLSRAMMIFETLQADMDWADALAGLAGLYLSERARHFNISSDLYEALITNLELAVSKIPRETRPEAHAIALTSLARALHKMAATMQATREELTGDLLCRELSIAIEAVEVVSASPDVHIRAMAEYALAEALVNSRETNALEDALQHFTIAITLLGNEHPVERFHYLRSYGQACMQFRRWRDAAAALETAIELAKSSNILKFRREGLFREGDLSDCISSKAYCDLQLGRPLEALVTLEGGRELKGNSHPPIDFRKIASKLDDECLLVPIFSPVGCAVVVLRPDSHGIRHDVIDLPQFDRMNAALHPHYFPSHAGWLGWLNTWRHERSRAMLRTRMDSLEYLLQELWTQFLKPILESPNNPLPRNLILIGHSGLQVLPVHAALLCGEGEETPRTSGYSLRFVQSLSAFERSCQLTNLSKESVLALGLSHYRDVRLRRIALAEDEAALVLRRFSPSACLLLTGAEATRKRLLAPIEEHGILHFACHGTWNRNPEESALQLWPEGRARLSCLTARDIQRKINLSKARLVILSACDSGVVEHMFAPDELAGLSGALLRAGADQVACSLWAVNDVASIFLWDHFYTCLAEGEAPNRALSHAQAHLRNLTVRSIRLFVEGDNFSLASTARILSIAGDLPDDARPFHHPLYWAPFVLYGA